MTDLLIPLASPNPATTDWVPLGNTGSVPTTQPSVRIGRSTAQSIPNNVWTAISFDTVFYDKGPAAHWVAGSPTRLTCQVAGTYVVSVAAMIAAASGGIYRQAAVYVNGTATTSIGVSGVQFTASGWTKAAAHTEVYLNVGDYVEAWIHQDSGGALNISGGASDALVFSMALLGGQQGPPGFASPPTYATTLPASPVDGQEAILVDSVTAPTYMWRFRYNAGSSSSRKWEFVGGAPAAVQPAANIGFTTAAYADLPGGPQFVIPRAGDYYAQASAATWYSNILNSTTFLTVGSGGALAFNADMAATKHPFATGGMTFASALCLVAGLAAGYQLRLQVKVDSGAAANISYPTLAVTPLRVS